MSLWFLLALMTAVAVFAVLWPLGRRTARGGGGRESLVYTDQLAEIDREVASGLISPADGGAARVEIGRRLLAAADAEAGSTAAVRLGWRRAVALVALIGLPSRRALSAARFAGDGRAAGQPQGASVASASIIDRAGAGALEKNPTDGRGWSVLAPVLVRVGRFDDAAQAYRNAIQYAGDDAAHRAGLGEALTGAANGVVTADAKAEFERAVKRDAGEAKANYFLGVAAEQDGRPRDAAAIWRAMLAKAPADAPWRPVVTAALARVDSGKTPVAKSQASPGKGPALADDTIASAKDMSEADRGSMIRGMVARLAARLKQNGDDVDGWLRLVRAYMVLNEPDKSRAARDDARRALGQDEAGLRQLNEGLKALGIDG